jgi:hypothetical protein
VAPSGRVAIGFPTSTSRVVAGPLLAHARTVPAGRAGTGRRLQW